MVSKEEYIKYIEELTSNDQGRIKMLHGKYLAVSFFAMFAGAFILLREVFLFVTFHYVYFSFKFVIGIILIISGIIILVIRNKNKKYCRNMYREKAINYILKDYDHYFNKDGWAMSWNFEHSQISKKFDLCSSSDCLIVNIPNDDGSSSKVDFKICDLYAYNFYRDKEGNVSHDKVYEGMFGCVEFPRKFKCVLCIDVNYKIKGIQLEKVELENIKFNKTFKVKSDNQIEARYILTPKMMEKLLFLENKFNNLRVVFIDNYLYIGAEDINMFELCDLENENVISVFEGLYEEINVILKIVEEIRDNNKVFKTSRKKRVKKIKEEEK